MRTSHQQRTGGEMGAMKKKTLNNSREISKLPNVWKVTLNTEKCANFIKSKPHMQYLFRSNQ